MSASNGHDDATPAKPSDGGFPSDNFPTNDKGLGRSATYRHDEPDAEPPASEPVPECAPEESPDAAEQPGIDFPDINTIDRGYDAEE